MVIRESCPQCGSKRYQKNGQIHTGKQNHRCNDGGRQFVLSTENRLIPEDLNVRLPEQPDGVIVQRLEVEADEAWSLLEKKANPPWLWLALDAKSRQVVVSPGGNRSKRSARKLWKKIPEVRCNCPVQVMKIGLLLR